MRNWWQPPRLRIGEGSETQRHATWLELFYDLVFVVAISELAKSFNEDISFSGFFRFAFLFLPVWWVWICTAFYTTRFGTDDFVHRFLTILQMVAIIALAVNIEHGLDQNSTGFALSYVAARGVLVIKYLCAIRYVPEARHLTIPYTLGFASAAIIWLVSVLIPIPLRFVLWTLGLVVDFATPILVWKLHATLPPHHTHLPERMGLFILIVLGESIAAVVHGVRYPESNGLSASCALFGLGIAFSFWWLYFENVGGNSIQSEKITGDLGAYYAWLYGHTPLIIGIAATGVGVKQVLLSVPSTALPSTTRILLCAAVALCLLSLGVLHRTGVIKPCLSRSWYRLGGAAGVVVVSIVGAHLLPVGFIGLLAFICAVQVLLEIYPSSVESSR